MKYSRRDFLKYAALTTGSFAVLPGITGCSSKQSCGLYDIPFTRPENWDPIAYNRKRGNRGAIPKSYLPSINGPDGVKKHLGKHLPYIPELDCKTIPKGYLPLMWGDPAKGYTMHPNAPKSEANNFEGHWYSWIRLRKATPWYAETAMTVFSGWPKTCAKDNGIYRVMGNKEITEDGGIYTVYLVKLPGDVKKGDTLRVWAHCLTHGEYIDFIRL